jgi:hypothetical protein
MWPVDPLSRPEGECAWHVYKDPDKVPDKYYDRLSLPRKPGRMRLAPAKQGRYFSDAELKELAMPMTDRIAETIRQGDLHKARRLCRDVKDEFLALHDLYVMMLLSTFTFIADHAGETALGEALELQFDKCIQEQIISKIGTMTSREKIVFLATKIFGTDNCNGSGYQGGKFSIQETNQEIRFVLNPCGSGGRLLRAGSYESMKTLQKIREKMENFIIRFSAGYLPLPEGILKILFPWVVTHFTQRKPYSQGKTAEARSWSFGEKGIPYYCCQCGKIAEKLSGTGLRIEFPRNQNDACVWKIAKTHIHNS